MALSEITTESVVERPTENTLASEPRAATASIHRRRLRLPVTVCIAIGFLVLIAVAIATPGLIATQSPIKENVIDSLLPPSSTYWFGTDVIGRDVFARVVYGARISVLVGIAAAAGSVIGGLVLGLAAGLGGRAADEVISRLTDVVISFPGILLAMVLVVFTGPGIWVVALAVAIAGIPRFARVVRAEALRLRTSDYVQHAVVFGASTWLIVLRHILPNVLSAIVVLTALDVGLSILASAGLSFLGMGPQPPDPEWGAMLADGRDVLVVAPWNVVFPGLALSLTVVALTVVGRYLERASRGIR